MSIAIFRTAIACMMVMTLLQADAAASDGAFNRLVGAAERIAESIPNGSKRDTAFSKIAIAYARRERYERIESLLSKIDSPQLRVNAILDVRDYSKIGIQNRETATRILSSANDLVRQMDNVATRDNLLRQVAYYQALSGQAVEAHKTAKLIEQAQYQIASAQARIGDIDGAIASAEAMRPGKWKNDAFAVIAGAIAKSGDINKARDIAGRSQGHTSIYFIATSRSEERDFESSLALAREIPSPSLRALSLRLMAEDAVKAGQLDIARNFLREARLSARDTKYPAGALTWIGAAQAKSGFISDAFETAAEIELRPLRERWTMGGDGLLWVFREIVQAQNGAGKTEEARITADLAARAWSNSGNQNDSAALEVVRIATTVGNFALAHEIAEKLSVRQLVEIAAPSGLRALEVIAIGHAKAGNYKNSFEIISEIAKARNREDAGDGTLWQVALEQIRRNDLDEALTTVSRIHDAQVQAIALTEMATLAKP